MNQLPDQPVLAMICDRQGLTLRVLRDDFQTRVEANQLWIGIVDHNSIMNALNFMREVLAKGAVYDWELGFNIRGQIEQLHCAGGVFDNGILVVASSAGQPDGYYETEMTTILAEYSSLMREQMRKHKDTDSSYIEEASRLNSELIHIQRELSKRNSELAENTRFIQRIFEAVPNLLTVYDLREQRLIFANREIIRSLGYTPEEIQQMGAGFLRQLLHPADLEVVEKHNQRMLLLADGETLEVEYRLQDAYGAWRWISSRDTVFARDADGIPTQILAAAQEITERKKVQEKLWYLSTHDSLTGLYNRGYFIEEMGRIEKSRAYPISILLADLDDLKKINDTLGHAAGDDLLRRAAIAIRACFRPGEVIARVGGDEFAVLLEHTSAATAQTILDRVRRMIEIESFSRPEKPRLGVSVGTGTAETPRPLIEVYKQADSQMYQDKLNRKQTGQLKSRA